VATGRQAIEAIAEVTGKPAVTIGRAARALREAGQDRDLWPHAAPGGGKKAKHVRADHLTNLAVALAVADPLTEAPRQIGAFLSMTAIDLHLPEEDGPIAKALEDWKHATSTPPSRLVPGETLGAALVHLVEFLARAEGAALRNAVLTTGSFHVIFRLPDGLDPSVRIRIQGGNLINDCWDYDRSGDYRPPGVPPAPQVPLEHPVRIQKIAQLPFHLFDTMAALWADTHARSEIRRANQQAGALQTQSAGGA
jgi:hypothetical protein